MTCRQELRSVYELSSDGQVQFAAREETILSNEHAWGQRPEAGKRGLPPTRMWPSASPSSLASLLHSVSVVLLGASLRPCFTSRQVHALVPTCYHLEWNESLSSAQLSPQTGVGGRDGGRPGVGRRLCLVQDKTIVSIFTLLMIISCGAIPLCYCAHPGKCPLRKRMGGTKRPHLLTQPPLWCPAATPARQCRYWWQS